MDEQNISLQIQRAKELQPGDLNGKSDPFVRITVMRGETVVSRYTTQIKKKTLEPEWNETFKFKANPKDKLNIDILDKDLISDDHLCSSSLLVSDCRYHPDLWIPLVPCGWLYLHSVFSSTPSSGEKTQYEKEVEIDFANVSLAHILKPLSQSLYAPETIWDEDDAMKFMIQRDEIKPNMTYSVSEMTVKENVLSVESVKKGDKEDPTFFHFPNGHLKMKGRKAFIFVREPGEKEEREVGQVVVDKKWESGSCTRQGSHSYSFKRSPSFETGFLFEQKGEIVAQIRPSGSYAKYFVKGAPGTDNMLVFLTFIAYDVILNYQLHSR